MDGHDLLPLLAGLAIGARLLHAFWKPSPQAIREATRLFRSHPRYDINAFPDQGEGRIVGTASPEASMLIAPVSGRECLGYVFRVRQYRGRSRTGGWWEEIMEVSRTVEFAVTDATGRALVHARDGRFVLTMDRADQSDSLCPASPRIEALLQECGSTSVGESFRYDESVLLPGEQVAVLGRGRYEAVEGNVARPGMAYRELARRLVVGRTRGNELVISNAPSTFD